MGWGSAVRARGEQGWVSGRRCRIGGLGAEGPRVQRRINCDGQQAAGNGQWAAGSSSGSGRREEARGHDMQREEVRIWQPAVLAEEHVRGLASVLKQ